MLAKYLNSQRIKFTNKVNLLNVPILHRNIGRLQLKIKSNSIFQLHTLKWIYEAMR